MLRDIVIAATFAVGISTDAFFAAFKIPNLLRRLTAEGAMTQSFVPVFNAQRNSAGEAAANKIRDDVASWLALVLAAIAAIGVVAAPLVVAVLAPGFAEVEGKQELAASLLRITFPYILLISLTAFGGAILNSHGHFAAFAFAPALLNVSLIGCALWLAPQLEKPIYALAWGVVLGGVLQLGWQSMALARFRHLPRLGRPRMTPEVKRTLKLTAQGAIGVAVAQLGIMINLVFASFLEKGSVSWLYFADRLMELPAGLLGAALGVIVLPTLSRQAAAGEHSSFSATIDWALRTALLFGAPAAVGMAALALPLVATFFQHGSYTANDSMQTSYAVLAYSFGVPALAVLKVLASSFYSRQDILTPVKVSIAALLVMITLNFILVPHLRHSGLALAVAAGSSINAIVLAGLLLRRGYYQPSKGWPLFALRIVLGCAAMLVALIWLRGDEIAWTETGALSRALRLGGCVIAGAAVYFAVLGTFGWRPSSSKPPAEQG